MPNRLAHETSPYLLQHQLNPVDWQPWGPEALAQARAEQKPIFLSIGYSACHWCHVMEHESFENAAIAAVLNEKFVSIKVDREERPDLDQIYMNAVQMMTGRGGWPMTVFLTPDLKPFYAGTYFPPTARGGMPGFVDVLRAVDDAWQNRRDQLGEMAERLTAELQRLDQGSPGALEEGCVGRAVAQLSRSFDPRFGGFGPAPKFPHAMDLRLLLRHWRRSGDAAALQMALFTLDRMAAGGIYDHLGGGFARYSVDAQWLVPHFEKMLYDNALLAAAYLDAYLAAGRPQDARCVRETLDYVLRDMTDAQGGFHSAEDADSEGEEGKFYVWTPAELRDLLGAEDAALFAVVYDVTDAGNFEGHNILHLPRPLAEAAAALQQDPERLRERLDACRAKLLAARDQRVRPGKDDKVLVSWNGLMIAALAQAGAALEESRYLAAAERAADFLWNTLRRSDGRLLHTWRQGVAKLDAYLDDYAGLAWGLFALFEATNDQRRLAQAAELVDQALTLFAAPDGGFYFTAHDHEQLIARNRDLMDNAVPSGNSLLAGLLVRLHLLTGRPHYGEAAGQTLAVAADLLDRAPSAMGQMLMAADLHLGPAYEWVLVGYRDDPETQRALRALRAAFLPHQLVVWADPAKPPASDALLANLLSGKTAERGQPVLYPCEGFACSAPIVGADAIAAHVRPSRAASE